MTKNIGEPVDTSDRAISPVRGFYAQILLFVLLVACVGLLISAMAFRDKLASVRTATTDDLGWIVSQIETDFLNFENAVKDAHIAAYDPEVENSDERLENLRRTFDIYYSRVDVYRKAIDLAADDSEIQSLYETVKNDRTVLAEAVDSIQDTNITSLKRIEELVSQVHPNVRDLTISTLHVHQKATAKAREEEKGLFYRFFFQSLGLSLLVGIGTYLVVRLWRELETKSQQTSNVAATLSKAFASTLNAVIVSNHQGVIRYCNKRTEDIFGWTVEELVGQTVGNSIVPHHLRDQHERGMARLGEWGEFNLVGKGLVKIEALHKDGHTFPIELSLEADKDIDGTPIILGFIRDISAQIAAEENLRESLENAKALAHEAESHAAAKGTFLATMSHEMRTPLHGVIASLDLMDDSVLDGDNLRFLKTARDCGARALQQVNDILEFTRLGESTEDLERFSPDDIVAGIIDELRPLARRRNNEMVFEFQGFENAPALLGYPFAFSRALYNLAGNAVKFTENGKVTIRLSLSSRPEDEYSLEVSVSDTGVGIAPEDQKRIFNKFETTTKGELSDVTGTGLGLPIAVVAVEQMGGEMQLSSTVGFGSRFYFTIPLVRDTSAHVREVTLKPADTGVLDSLNILVVDDNEVNVTLMSEMVKRLGHRATPAENGQVAVDLAAQNRYDVILMDFSMPVMDGPEAARRIRTGNGVSHDSLIIGVTALITANDPSASDKTRHMETVLIKPVGQSQLDETLRTYVPKLKERLAHKADDEFDEDLLDDEELDGSEIFDAVILGMGEEVGFRLIKATLDDAALAVEAMEEVGGDLDERARRIHKAVGSTGMTGMLVLSQTLSAAEVLALDGDDPSQTHLPSAARTELERITAIYNAMTEDYEPAE